LKKLNQAIDRFCILHPNFGIPNLMLYVVIGNVVLGLLSNFSNGSFLSFFSYTLSGLLHGQVWRLVTFVLIPESTSPFYLLITCYFYYWIGSTLERQWGTAKFTTYYLSGMLLTVVGASIVSLITGYSIPVYGANYVNFAMFMAFALLYPDAQVLLFFIIPIKVKYLAYVDAALFVLGVVTTSFPLNLLPVVAVLNYLVYCGDWLFDFFRPSHVRQRQKTVNFKREARRIQREQANKPYHYKCAVCGRTDVDHPELEFRYCSRCVGYHCFCQDHINNHVHFTE